MSILAIFHLKNQSLLEFDDLMRGDLSTEEGIEKATKRNRKKDIAPEEEINSVLVRRENIKNLYKIKNVPSDTQLRTFLDQVRPEELTGLFKMLFSLFQRSNYLERFQYGPLDNRYLLAVDGTGFFSSSEIHCDHCCEKKHKEGSKEYYHQALCGVIVHPSLNVVIPLLPEPITRTDGSAKNDCERNASKRFYEQFRRDHPHLQVIATEDGLSPNAPHINLLNDLKIDFIIVCKPKDHTSLFDFIEGSRKINATKSLVITEGQFRHEFEWMNGVPLNDKNADCLVNFVKYTQIETVVTKKGPNKGNVTEKRTTWTWVTSLTLTADNVYAVMRAGRARWKIENETFSTLKNYGYNLEHNYGHGSKNLPTNLLFFMILAFLIDQIQWLTSILLNKAKKRFRTYRSLWAGLRSYVDIFLFKSWEDLYLALANGIKVTGYEINSS
jgi:hypothetical protein